MKFARIGREQIRALQRAAERDRELPARYAALQGFYPALRRLDQPNGAGFFGEHA